MPAFQFKRIILHALPGPTGGWEVIGVRYSRKQEVIAILPAVLTEQEAKRLANHLAKNLAGQPYAEVD